MTEVLAFVLGLAVAEAFHLVRDLTVEKRRAENARKADERRWEREDGIRAEAAQEVLDAERRRAEREDALWNREVQAARRLVADEPDTIHNQLSMIAKHGRWPDAKVVQHAGFLSMQQWEEHKAKLAEAMEDDTQFFNLAGFMYSTRQLAAKMPLTPPGAPLTDEDKERLKRMRTDSHALYWVVLGSHRLLVHDDGKRELVANEDAPEHAPIIPYGPVRPDGSALTDSAD